MQFLSFRAEATAEVEKSCSFFGQDFYPSRMSSRFTPRVLPRFIAWIKGHTETRSREYGLSRVLGTHTSISFVPHFSRNDRADSFFVRMIKQRILLWALHTAYYALFLLKLARLYKNLLFCKSDYNERVQLYFSPQKWRRTHTWNCGSFPSLSGQ